MKIETEITHYLQHHKINQIYPIHEEIEIQIVLFVILSLIVGSLSRIIHKKTRVPYTPILVIFGLFMGLFHSFLGLIGKSIYICSNINPHLLLLVFIPTLLFQPAYNSNWFVFKKQLPNILILAGPGILLQTFLIGITLKIILGYNELTWPMVFMIGSIISATDPVAVIELLKDLKASIFLNTLIEGESLLNDGTAMVFQQMFLQIISGHHTIIYQAILNLLKTSIGGLSLGLLIGLLSIQ